jgi:parvulin-like peptidyl-prolyl isomerase
MGRIALVLCSSLLATTHALPAPPRSSAVYAVVKSPKGEIKAPLFAPDQGSLLVAKVGDRAVTLSELAAAITAAHDQRAATEAKARKRKDFKPVLDRLIGVQLIVQEAEAMGLDDLEDVKADLVKYRELALREQLQRRALAGVEPDPAELERMYRDAVREWKLRSALFAKEEDANALVRDAKAGKPFDELLNRAVAEKKAQGGARAEYFSEKMRMLPAVLQAVEKLQPGQISGAIKVDQGFAVVRVEDIRYPEDASAREEARGEALAGARTKALRIYYDGLVARYAKIDQKLLEKIDFEAEKPGFATLEKDQRSLVVLEGGRRITVADLTAELRVVFFHDIQHAIKSKKVNRKKAEILDVLISRQVVALEAALQKIAESPEYLKALADHRDQVLFGTFITRVVLPAVKITEGDLKRYYDKHRTEFTYPAFYGLLSLTFTSQAAAEAAMAQLRKGADFKWVQGNADGQVPPEKRAVELDGGTISAKGLVPEIAAAVAGAQAGDLRRAELNGQHIVLVVKQARPPAPQPYAEKREIIAPLVQDEMVNRSMADWIARLRKAQKVEVYLTRIVS